MSSIFIFGTRKRQTSGVTKVSTNKKVITGWAVKKLSWFTNIGIFYIWKTFFAVTTDSRISNHLVNHPQLHHCTTIERKGRSFLFIYLLWFSFLRDKIIELGPTPGLTQWLITCRDTKQSIKLFTSWNNQNLYIILRLELYDADLW